MHRLTAALFLLWSSSLFAQTSSETQTLISLQQTQIKALQEQNKALEAANKALTDRFNAVVDINRNWTGNPTNLVGPRGPTGASGPKGDPGAKGDPGPSFSGVIRMVSKFPRPNGPVFIGSCKDACAGGETCIGGIYMGATRACSTETSGPPASHYCLCAKN